MPAYRTIVRNRPAAAGAGLLTGRVVQPWSGVVAVTREQEEAINAADLAFYLGAYLRKYVILPCALAYDMVVLWVLHTHLRGRDHRLATMASPRLLVTSDDPGSGKSRLLRLLLRLCAYTYGLDTEPTAPGLIATLQYEFACVLIDEGDILFGAGARKEAVRAIFNSGYSPDGTTLRVRGGKPDRPHVFGPIAIAALRDMQRREGSEKLRATLDRCLEVQIEKSGGKVPKLNAEADAHGLILKASCVRWARENPEVALAEPDMGDEVSDRSEELWAPLVGIADAIAEQAAECGWADDDWPARARAAMAEETRIGFFGSSQGMAQLRGAFGARDQLV
jgi:hypothetical protein